MHLAEVGDGYVEETSWVPVHNSLHRHASMIFGSIFVGNDFYQASRLC